MHIIFEEDYVNYNQISDISLIEINDVLERNDIYLELGDDSFNDWAGYAYYYCKSLGNFDDETISSFVYIITWFMTGVAIDINPNFKSNRFYKNDEIIYKCSEIYNELNYKYESKVDLCKDLFNEIYDLYLYHQDNYLRRGERISIVLNYKQLKLLDAIGGKNRTAKIRVLLDNYYDNILLNKK